MRKLKKAVAVVLMAASLMSLAACGSKGKTELPTLAEAAAGETFEGSGYTVVIPDTWKKASMSGYEFVVYRLADGGGDFAENINILKEDLSAYTALSLDEYVTAAKEQLKKTSGYAITGEKKVTVNGEEAVILNESIEQDGETYLCQQMVIVKTKKAYIITYSGDSEGGYEAGLAEAESIMASFKIK